MKRIVTLLASLLLTAPTPAADLKFRVQEIDATLKCGYGVVVSDVNGDGKPDIVVADAIRVVWYENPTWKRRTMIEGAVPPDIVCIAACDIDGDGKIDFFIGADWRPFDTTTGGTIHWMRRGKTLDDPWQVFKIGEEPSVHRMKVMDKTLIVAPLMGRDATKENNWLDGRPVRILRYGIPPDPVNGPWKADNFAEWKAGLHVVHNFKFKKLEDTGHGRGLIVASIEGVTYLGPRNVSTYQITSGNQDTPKSGRGAGEVAEGALKSESILTTIEPWHGHEVVVYITLGPQTPENTRRVIDDKLRCGHALWCSDLDGGGSDWIIAGVRDDLSKNPGERRGVRIYRCPDGKGDKWERQIVDDGGIACEDLTVADLNGDGKPDIIATGRQTGNVRIYWNEGR